MNSIWNVAVRLALVCVAGATGLTTARAAVSVEQAWNDEYQELAGQMARCKTARPEWRSRLQAEALDSQALIQ